MILEGAKYCIYSGDVSKNNAVDLADVLMVYNAATSFTSGFNALDLTGDRTVDLTDVLIAFNNSTNFVSRQAPPGAVIISGNPITTSEVKNVYQYKTDIQKIEEPVIIEKSSIDKRNNDMKSNTNKK